MNGNNYYVIFAGTGNESEAKRLIRKSLDTDLCPNVFYPQKKMKKKIRGQEVEYTSPLIPGYIFLRTDRVQELYQKLRDAHVFHRILGVREEGEDEIFFYNLTDSETDWVRKRMGRSREMGDDDPVIELSQIRFREDKSIEIVSGPLLEYSGHIQKINVHGRWANVRTVFFGREMDLHFGIEIVE